MSDSDRPRPQAKPRRAPRPAADEQLDTVVQSAPAPARPQATSAPKASPKRAASTERTELAAKLELPVSVPRRRRGEPTVQLNVRQPPEVAALIDQVVAATGAPKAEVVEAAIRAAYQK